MRVDNNMQSDKGLDEIEIDEEHDENENVYFLKLAKVLLTIKGLERRVSPSQKNTEMGGEEGHLHALVVEREDVGVETKTDLY